jgi:hypothetical protein
MAQYVRCNEPEREKEAVGLTVLTSSGFPGACCDKHRAQAVCRIQLFAGYSSSSLQDTAVCTQKVPIIFCTPMTCSYNGSYKLTEVLTLRQIIQSVDLQLTFPRLNYYLVLG